MMQILWAEVWVKTLVLSQLGNEQLSAGWCDLVVRGDPNFTVLIKSLLQTCWRSHLLLIAANYSNFVPPLIFLIHILWATSPGANDPWLQSKSICFIWICYILSTIDPLLVLRNFPGDEIPPQMSKLYTLKGSGRWPSSQWSDWALCRIIWEDTETRLMWHVASYLSAENLHLVSCIRCFRSKSTLLSVTLYMHNTQHKGGFSPLWPTAQQSNTWERGAAARARACPRMLTSLKLLSESHKKYWNEKWWNSSN